MNFQQLRIIREAVRRDFNLTEVANALFTSQSGVSKHIKDIEDELGIELFIRRGKRLTGLTDLGKEIVGIVERMLLDANNIKHRAEQFAGRDEGRLSIATTHTQARYSLPDVVTKFKLDFPKVHLVLHQSSPREIIDLLRAGEADIGIATEALESEPDLVTFPWYDWHHSVIVPDGHPLTKERALTLTDLADYPLITYHEGITGGSRVGRAFSAIGISPDVVMSALDADVIKTYVELKLGIGIIASMAFNPRKDTGLVMLDGAALFPKNTTRIAIRQGHYLRGYAYRFLELCSEHLEEGVVRAALTPGRNELE